jgi:hypothetical protein
MDFPFWKEYMAISFSLLLSLVGFSSWFPFAMFYELAEIPSTPLGVICKFSTRMPKMFS